MRKMKKRLVSDIVAEIMMILVVLAVGVIVIAYLSSYSTSFINIINIKNSKQQLNIKQYIIPMGAYIHNNTLYVIFNTGPWGEELYSVFINNSLINSCEVSYNNNGWHSLPYTLPQNTIAVIKCQNVSLPSSVTISYSGGEVEVEASPT
ncbi:MAG: hypothetical protein F7B11_01410 [Caldisphaeraceae archaeon]|nr:hypothetical protein [Caldisphaeraceae archaeon]MEB2793453.1 hypothetical protein [Caldisphaeraceae archaeon]MEB3798425.1 hypothetical protein [Caldisphaeraceae archaeon]